MTIELMANIYSKVNHFDHSFLFSWIRWSQMTVGFVLPNNATITTKGRRIFLGVILNTPQLAFYTYFLHKITTQNRKKMGVESK